LNYIGDNIRKKRNKAKLNQTQLAEALELDQTSICRFENGSRRPSVEQLKKIAVTLGCSFVALVNEEPEEYSNLRIENSSKNKSDSENIFLQTLLNQNPDMRVQLNSLAKRSKKMTSEDWQFLGDHLMHAFRQVEMLLDR
jgi:transcriptional regulator with XRE-family HTH domain